MTATAAKGVFPYPGRTVAEVDRAQGVTSATPAQIRRWRAQCDRMVSYHAGCASRFCSLRSDQQVAA